MPRLGALGNLVWDRIYAHDNAEDPAVGWGGITYALHALAAALTDDWVIVPILKVGEDLAEEAIEALRSIPRLDHGARPVTVHQPQYRVELRYRDRDERTERLTGELSPWTWVELEPIVTGLDALYINFITGTELELDAVRQLRAHFEGPIYVDLHSLFMGIGEGGERYPRPLDDRDEWLSAFDIVQVNDHELGLLADGEEDPWRFAAKAVGHVEEGKGTGPDAIFVTQGRDGAAYVTTSAFAQDPLGCPMEGASRSQVRSDRIQLGVTEHDGDPTGCGDVWGATCFARLLGGATIDDALYSANRAASRNVLYRGTNGLHHFLQGQIET